MFRDIATKGLLIENVDFLQAILSYKSKAEDHIVRSSVAANGLIKRDAEALFGQFLKVDSPHEVNVSSTTRGLFMARMREWVDDDAMILSTEVSD